MGVYVRIVPMQKPYGRSVPRNSKEASVGTFRPKSGKFIKEDRRDQLFVTNVNQIQYGSLGCTEVEVTVDLEESSCVGLVGLEKVLERMGELMDMILKRYKWRP